jgi:hypothetical protein
MSKKISVIIILLFTLLVSLPASAVDNTSQIPELNPFCWHLKDCQKQRKLFGGSGKGTEGFFSQDPCSGGDSEDPWGRCQAAGTAKTEISFGGKSEFNNVGDFIVLMYKYMLTIASIVAAAMIMIAGVQWIISGGNSERIGSAKKRIAGALIGLFIGYASYFVLNTINPALVNLRLPQVWMVKPMSLTPEFCSELEKPGSEGSIRFMHAAAASEQVKSVTLETADKKADGFKWKLSTDRQQFVCGDRFFVESGGKTPCMGNLCPLGKTCFDNVGKRVNYTCGDVRIGGDISAGVVKESCGHLFLGGFIEASGISSPWSCPPIVDSWLMPVCNNQITDIEWEKSSYLRGGREAGNLLDDLDFGDGYGETTGGHYRIEVPIDKFENDSMHRCDKFGGVKGFIVNFKMDLSVSLGKSDTGKQEHFVGKGGVDLGRSPAALRILHKLNPQYMFTVDEIRNGTARLNVTASDIEEGVSLGDKQKKHYDL